MKSARQILAEMGFNPDAPEGSKRALFTHLKRQADLLSRREPPRKPEPTPGDEQLKFDEDVLRRR